MEGSEGVSLLALGTGLGFWWSFSHAVPLYISTFDDSNNDFRISRTSPRSHVRSLSNFFFVSMSYFVEMIQLCSFAFVHDIPWPSSSVSKTISVILNASILRFPPSWDSFPPLFWISAILSFSYAIDLFAGVLISSNRSPISAILFCGKSEKPLSFIHFLVYVWKLSFFPFMNVLLSALTCSYQHGNDYMSLKGDTSIRCWDSTIHILYISVVVILFLACVPELYVVALFFLSCDRQAEPMDRVDGLWLTAHGFTKVLLLAVLHVFLEGRAPPVVLSSVNCALCCVIAGLTFLYRPHYMSEYNIIHSTCCLCTLWVSVCTVLVSTVNSEWIGIMFAVTWIGFSGFVLSIIIAFVVVCYQCRRDDDSIDESSFLMQK